MRVLVAFDVPDDQADDIGWLQDAVAARLQGEAGYLPDGMPITPVGEVCVVTVDDDTPLDADGTTLLGIYNVGAEGAL